MGPFVGMPVGLLVGVLVGSHDGFGVGMRVGFGVGKVPVAEHVSSWCSTSSSNKITTSVIILASNEKHRY